MSIPELLQWQWKDYGSFHQNKTNLLIHIVTVPLFMSGTLALVAAVLELSVLLLALSIFCMAISLAMEGRGHKMEPVAPIPFTSPFNAVSRLFLEQWITFPRFVLSGGWYRNLLKASSLPHDSAT